ncbi:hypothetical protein Cgig2_014735 [Carnegiea gigantea]|uniref:Ubiquitin-like protease family profile domain-containing protein n=1 Tax=Carnegiea gigantea TaxID=171969 RepID=A0A9Q1L2N1_9CARY|nr:hypothetical protein Cgig2_014735 [Carnegiea gigantea]
MKLRSAKERRESPQGRSGRAECGRGEHSEAEGKRKRRMSEEERGSGDDEVAEVREGGCGGRQTGKGGKGKGDREGERRKHEVLHRKGRNGKVREKDDVADDGEDGAGVSGVVNDVILRSRCTLRSISALNGRLNPYQREAVLGTVLRPVLEYGEMAMERHLTLALIKSWDRRKKAFRVGGREVRFTVFDVVMFTGLPGIGKKVELDGEEVMTEVGNMVRARMAEWERAEMARRVPKKSGQKRRFFKNYVNVMMELCEENAEADRVGIWLRLYAFIVVSGVFFPRTPYGAAWSLLHYVDDVDCMGQYAWAEAIWEVVVESIEDTQKKLARGLFSEVMYICVGVNMAPCVCVALAWWGDYDHCRSHHRVCCIVGGDINIPVTKLLAQVWFYEHTTRFCGQDGQRFPRIASWRKVDHGGMYDATELLAELEESEVKPILEARGPELQETVVRAYMETDEYRFYVEDGEGVLSFDERLRRVREAYALEKQANMRMSAELALMKDRVRQLEERLREFGAGNGDGAEGAEGACGETLNGATVTEGTGEPTALGAAATQDPSTPPNIVAVNLSADTEVGRTCNNDVVEEGNGREREHATVVAREPDVASLPVVEGATEKYEHVAAADDDDRNIASAAQSVQTPTEEPVQDAYSVVPTTDSVAVGDGGADEPPLAGDGAHCVPDLSKSTTSHTADDQSCPRSSNIVSRLKKVPRIRKPSRVRGSPYTNPTRGTKGGRRGVKSAAPRDTTSGRCSPSRVQSDVGNDDAIISLVPIAEVPPAGEVELPAVRDARLMDDVPDTLTSGPSPDMPAPRTRGTGGIFPISEEGVKVYLMWTLSPEEVDLLAAVRARCKGLKGDQWNFDLPEATEKHVNAEFLKGLINVVPTRGAADRPGRYCIGSFAVQQYSKLLHSRQRQHRRYCRMSVFLDRHDEVFMPLFERVSQHWLLLLADVTNRRFLVYDSLQSKRDGPRQRLLCSAVSARPSYVITQTCMFYKFTSSLLSLQKVAIGLALMKLPEFCDVLSWEMENAECPQQDNGHDCGVYMLMFMDLLSIRADGLYFGQPYVRNARDKLLLSLLQERVAHFPEAFLEGT